MAELLLGPLLRYVGETDATVWVETDAPCEVEVCGSSTRTFRVGRHHYALVHVTDLDPAQVQPYEVKLDGEIVWPERDSPFPPSVIRTFDASVLKLEVMFGSCRVTAPHVPPYTFTKDEDDRGREHDALYALALRLRGRPSEDWPELLVMLGDQVYADECSPGTREYIEAKRDPSGPPGYEVADYEEYTHLYLESWRDPAIRWLLSVLPTAMIFDDHDVHDDWNTSRAWVEEYRSKPWWDERIAGAFASYWVYQHIGNLSPGDLAEDEMYERVCAAEDAWPLLREFGLRADRATEGTRWSYCRDIGATRLVMMDSRAGRVLADGRRCMVDDEEWDWISEHATGGFDHLLLGTSLPFLLAPGMQHLEAWNERVCDGAYGPLFVGLGERIRQGLDLEHWGAFDESFQRLVHLLEEVAAGRRGEPPATITLLSGDVHHAYLAEIAFRRGSGVRSAVNQAVCSPFRNPLDANERRAIRFAASRTGELIGRALARSARARDPGIRWRLTGDPVFDNQIATYEIDGRSASLRIERAILDEHPDRALETTFERKLA